MNNVKMIRKVALNSGRYSISIKQAHFRANPIYSYGVCEYRVCIFKLYRVNCVNHLIYTHDMMTFCVVVEVYGNSWQCTLTHSQCYIIKDICNECNYYLYDII